MHKVTPVIVAAMYYLAVPTMGPLVAKIHVARMLTTLGAVLVGTTDEQVEWTPDDVCQCLDALTPDVNAVVAAAAAKPTAGEVGI